jgi:hypothetical protein
LLFDDFLSIFGNKILALKDGILGNMEFQKNRSVRDWDDQLFEAVSTRGKE